MESDDDNKTHDVHFRVILVSRHSPRSVFVLNYIIIAPL